MAIKKFKLSGEERDQVFTKRLYCDRKTYEPQGLEVAKFLNVNPLALTHSFVARYKDATLIVDDNERLGTTNIILLCDNSLIDQREDELRRLIGHNGETQGAVQ